MILTQARVPYDVTAREWKDGGFRDSYACTNAFGKPFPTFLAKPSVTSSLDLTILAKVSDFLSSPPKHPLDQTGARRRTGDRRLSTIPSSDISAIDSRYSLTPPAKKWYAMQLETGRRTVKDTQLLAAKI